MQLGHVNNVVYLRWVQEVAVADWRAAAPAADQDALLWVVMRHEIDYKRPAFLNDEIISAHVGWRCHPTGLRAAYRTAARIRSTLAGARADVMVSDRCEDREAHQRQRGSSCPFFGC